MVIRCWERNKKEFNGYRVSALQDDNVLGTYFTMRIYPEPQTWPHESRQEDTFYVHRVCGVGITLHKHKLYYRDVSPLYYHRGEMVFSKKKS